MLIDSNEPGDREKATWALAITQEIGMRPITERILTREIPMA
jgi:hypothetical protein